MQIHIETVNPYFTNSYFLIDEASGETVLIDPAFYYRREKKYIELRIRMYGWKIKRVVATHLHIDHVFGAYFMKETYGLSLEASQYDNFWTAMAEKRCEEVGLGLFDPIEPVEKFLNDGDVIEWGSERLEVLSVPGHSPGSLAFYSPAYRCVFVGDLLFRDAIGRTDLVGGDEMLLQKSVIEKIFSLGDDVLIYPGHDEATSVGRERKNSYWQRLLEK